MSRRPIDLLSLAFGLLFAALGLVLLSGGRDALSLGWAGPLTAIALGAILIAAARSSGPAPDDEHAED